MTLVVGFMPLLDCASVVVAAERGFAAEEGLDLRLVRETSWANIRDRLIVGHFDAAHMLAPMTIASTLGIGHIKCPFIAPMALGLGGNAITVSRSLSEQIADLKRVVKTRPEPLTFGIVYPFSCHNYEIRHWLFKAGIDPDRDVRLVVIPPPFLVDALRTGQIDGFCAGEPWNSVAVDANVGVIAAPTTEFWPQSPEKVLGCRAEWAAQHPDELDKLIRAIYRAAMWLDDPENHAEVARLLAQPNYVGTSASVLLRGLESKRFRETFPHVDHAIWIYEQMVRWRQIEALPEYAEAARATYRPDIYERATQ